MGCCGFALKLDSDTNNTSLVLAIELPDGRVLLFPGIAGGELGIVARSDVDRVGRPQGDGCGSAGSDGVVQGGPPWQPQRHAARGLELMSHPELVAMVPSMRRWHEKKHWTRMPFVPLMARLAENARLRASL
jgi:hypothetical protein